MAENTLDVRLLHAAKTLADWNNVTTIPKLGEVCLEIQGNTPPLNYKIKIGDGSSTYAALPYFGTVVNTSGNASVVVVDTITDGSVTRKVLKFYKFTLTTSTVNGVTTITPTIGDLILTVQEGDGIHFSTNTTDTLVNVELEATTADTAQIIADGGTFTAVTKDSSDKATKYTTFTLPSIANSINALDVADNTIITAEWDSTNKQIKFYYVKETDGIIQKGSLAYTINATDIAPVQNITTTDTGDSGLEITTNNNVKDVHHKAVTQNVVDNSSVVGEKELDIITNVEVDSYGHITGYSKDKSTNLIAADIKAPVIKPDNTTWNFRETGGGISIGEDVAKIPSLKGNTMVWNQLVPNTYIDYTNTNTDTKTYLQLHLQWFNNTMSVIATQSINSSLGKYGTIIEVPAQCTNCRIKHNGSSADLDIVPANALFVSGNHKLLFQYTVESTDPTTVEGIVIKNINVIDLTLMFGETVANSMTVEDFEKLFPNSYYPYNEGELLSLNPTGVKSVGFNLWDEETIEGALNYANGSVTPTTNRLCTKNYVRVLPSTQYYFSTDIYRVACYDSNKNYIQSEWFAPSESEGLHTTGPNTHYVMCDMGSSYGGTYNNDICINLSDTNRNGTYEPYKESTLDLSWIKSIKDTGGNQLFPYGLLSAGLVHDEVGEDYAIKRIGSVDLGSLTWTYTLHVYGGSTSKPGFTTPLSNINNIKTSEPDITPNALCVSYQTSTVNGIYRGTISKALSYATDFPIGIADSTAGSDPAAFKKAMSGVMLYYELATPIEVDIVPAKNMSYLVNDLGTETQLPVNPPTTTPVTAPFVGTFEYKSNFKDTVIDLIDKVNNAVNPVKGINNTDQTVGKIAVYDSERTTASSNYSASNATIVEGATDNDIILPSVATVVDYVNSKLSSALNYKGTISQWSDLPTSGQNTGDMYIAATTFTEGSTTYQAGDFFIWNGTSWDIVSGTTSVVNTNPTLTPNGNTWQVGTVDGRPLQVTTPNLNTSSSTISQDGKSIEFIDNVSQTNGLISATKKIIPTATAGVNGVNYDILVPPSTSLWSSIYAPINVGTNGQILKSNGIGAPNWATLSLSDLSLYSKKLSYKLNSSTATELGTIVRDADSDLTLPEFYAPITAGNQYNLLMSNGSGAPSWLNFGNSEGYLKKTSSGWSLMGDSNLFFPNEDVWFYQSLPQGVSALDIAVGAQPSGIELNFYGGDGITLKKVVNASQHVLGVQINASPIVNTLQTLSSNSDTGYLKKTAADTWELDPYGGGSLKPAYFNNVAVTPTAEPAPPTGQTQGTLTPNNFTDVLGLREQTGESNNTPVYQWQKIPFTAICNDTTTRPIYREVGGVGTVTNETVTIILNGNFS